MAAEQGLNCIGDRELTLRNMGIIVIENLALAKDGFDVIDLTSNSIRTLGDGFPPFPRLTTLHVAHNSIERIESGLAASLPNLHTLILTANSIATIEQLNVDELSQLKSLEVLSLLDNPIMQNVPDVRRLLLSRVPSLKVFNFSKVSETERVVQQVESVHKKKKKNKKKMEDASMSVTVKRQRASADKDDDESRKEKKRKLTTKQSDDIRKFIERAKCIDDVTRIQEAVQNGTVDQFLAAQPTA